MEGDARYRSQSSAEGRRPVQRVARDTVNWTSRRKRGPFCDCEGLFYLAARSAFRRVAGSTFSSPANGPRAFAAWVDTGVQSELLMEKS